MDRQLSRALPWLLACSLVVLLAPRVRAENRASYGGSAQAALASAPTSFDPLRGGPGDAEIAALVYDTLYVVDPAGAPRPWLVQSLEQQTPLRARLQLRPDVHFSDGTPLTAHDVAYSLARAQKDQQTWLLGVVRSVRALPDGAVQIDLARPTPELPLLLSTPAAMITPNGVAPTRRPIGSGPFIVDSSDGSGVHLVANESCFAGRPYLASLQLRAFASRTEESAAFEVGSLAALRHGPLAADAGAAHRPAATIDGPQTVTGFIAVGRGPDAPLLRRVLELAINRDRLRRLTVREPAQVAGDGVPAALGGSSPRPAYDPARARTEVEQRWHDVRPRLGLLVDASRFDDRDVGERILADLARVGIDVTLDVVDAATYQARLDAGRYELVLGSVAAPAPDATLAALALVGVADAAAARALLARGGAVDLAATRVVPLFHRATRLQVAPALRDLRIDGAGRASWADANWTSR